MKVNHQSSRILLSLTAVGLICFNVIGCNRSDTDRAIDRASGAVDRAASDTEHAMDRAADKVKDATN